MTFAAAGAFFIVHMGDIVRDADRALLADLDALHAADTACLALLSRLRALIHIAAKDSGLRFVTRDHFDQLFRTDADAGLTRLAAVGIDPRHAVANKDRIVRASLYAVTEADTAVGTALGTA